MIVFFDGVCGLCNQSVDFLLARDRDLKLQFAPLQGSTARAKLPARDLEQLDSLVILDGEKIYRKSDGALKALGELGRGYALIAKTARLFPRALRDGVYSSIAKNRYRLFGKRETCRLPTPAERSRFLD